MAAQGSWKGQREKEGAVERSLRAMRMQQTRVTSGAVWVRALGAKHSLRLHYTGSQLQALHDRRALEIWLVQQKNSTFNTFNFN